MSVTKQVYSVEGGTSSIVPVIGARRRLEAGHSCHCIREIWRSASRARTLR
jgi:hypothetical protein